MKRILPLIVIMLMAMCTSANAQIYGMGRAFDLRSVQNTPRITKQPLKKAAKPRKRHVAPQSPLQQRQMQPSRTGRVIQQQPVQSNRSVSSSNQTNQTHSTSKTRAKSDKCLYCGGTGVCRPESGGSSTWCYGTGKCASCGGNGYLNGHMSTGQCCPNCQKVGHDEVSTSGTRYCKPSNGVCSFCGGNGKCRHCKGSGKR